MPLSLYWASAMINAAIGGATFTPPATHYVGLSSTTPSPDGTGITEPSGGGYALVAVTNNLTNWGANTTDGTRDNDIALTFPLASATWLSGVNLTYAVVYDTPTRDHLFAYGALSIPKPVFAGDQPQFAIGAFDWVLT